MLKQLTLSIMLISGTLFAKNISYNFKDINLSSWNTSGKWEISKNAKEHYISMIKRGSGFFNFCYTNDVKLKNGSISVAFRANAGQMDQGGGLMWRVQDNENYYVVRFNPLEDNFRFYIVQDGMRSNIASATVKLSSGWHTMKIEQKDATFNGYVDGKKYLEYKDAQIKKAGGVGVWTKSDAQTSFDNLKINVH